MQWPNVLTHLRIDEAKEHEVFIPIHIFLLLGIVSGERRAHRSSIKSQEKLALLFCLQHTIFFIVCNFHENVEDKFYFWAVTAVLFWAERKKCTKKTGEPWDWLKFIHVFYKTLGVIRIRSLLPVQVLWYLSISSLQSTYIHLPGQLLFVLGGFYKIVL